MSQHDMNIANQGFPAFRSDLNDALNALATTSAGTAEPSTTFANQLWYDSTNDLLKMRNSDNDAWITLAYFDQVADEWQIRSAVIQAVDAAGVQIKTDDGTTRIDIQDDGDISFNSGDVFIDSSGNVGIGTTTLEDTGSDWGDLTIGGNTGGFTSFTDGGVLRGKIGTSGTTMYVNAYSTVGNMVFGTNNGTERMRVDSSGNLLINSGTNATPGVGDTDTGVSITETNAIFASRNQATGNSSATIFANRNTTDGGIITLYQNGNEIGEIGVDNGDLYIGTGSYGLAFRDGSADIRPFSTNTGGDTNGTTDLGGSGVRFREIFATNGTINVSDINEKQDIEELSEAEQRVAVAAKGLLRKFRWKDMVAEKGNDARIHFGIMAQDLQAAFEAEGLDAGRYSMFVKETYYELLIDVPAVEAQDAVLDDEGNIVTEAVEAKEAYTKRTVYKAHQEIPEGAEPVTTYGVRYSELLAFIIAAI